MPRLGISLALFQLLASWLDSIGNMGFSHFVEFRCIAENLPVLRTGYYVACGILSAESVIISFLV